MPLLTTQYATPAPSQLVPNLGVGPLLFGPPTASSSLSAGQSTTVTGPAGSITPGIVRLLARGGDFAVAWSTGATEVLKDGIPEYRLLVPGTVIACTAAP